MMLRWIVFLAFGPQLLCAQWEHPDLKMGFQWKYFEDSTITEKAKQKLISRFSQTGQDALRVPAPGELPAFQKDCHFVDFNGDSLTDVIFTGIFPGESRKSVIFFQHTPDGLEAIMRLNGDLRLMSKLHGKFKGIRITIMKHAIGESVVNVMSAWYIEKDRGTVDPFYSRDGINQLSNDDEEFCTTKGAKLIRKYIYLNNLYFPEAAGTKALRTFQDTAVMMQKPKPLENFDFSQPLSYFLKQSPIENKAVAMIRPGTDCIAIGYEVLDAVPYFLVMIDNRELLSNYLAGEDGYQIGWISGKHVMSDGLRDRGR